MIDNRFMLRAVELAYKSKGLVKTNPSVGAVLVKDNEIISEGWHSVYGGPHAEIVAINKAGTKAAGSTLYVTLEPCSTFGKTPPCTEAIIKAGIKKVVVGVVDPNPCHAGCAITALDKVGVDIIYGVESIACAKLIEDFNKYITVKKPYVTMKIAQSLDGKIATKSGDSKWITSEESRVMVHELRRRSDAVLIGVGTALADNPELTVRLVETDKQPMRVILDSMARLPVNSKLATTTRDGLARTIMFISPDADTKQVDKLEKMSIEAIAIPKKDGYLDINQMLSKLANIGVMNLFVEGGSEIFGKFIDERAVDMLHLFIAPTIIGGNDAKSSVAGAGADKLSDAIKFLNAEMERISDDIHVFGRLNDYTKNVIELTDSKIDCKQG